MEIYLIRHAESEGNRKRCGGGTYDWNLSEHGQKQAQSLRNAEFAQSITRLYSSPLIRTRDTASVLADVSGKSIEIDSRLIDVNAGELNGAAWKDIRVKYADFFKHVPRNPSLPFPNGGETNRDVIERTRSFATDLREQYQISKNQYKKNAVIAIVSHGLPLNYLILH